jgi:hypothetical protein
LVVRETVVASVAFAGTEDWVCANERVAAAKTNKVRDMFFTECLDLEEMRTS